MVAQETSVASGPGFESDISHNDHDALQDHCVTQAKKNYTSKDSQLQDF